MRKKLIIAGIITVLLILGGVTAVLVAGSGKTPATAPRVATTAAPTPSPLPSVSPEKIKAEEGPDFSSRYPALARLPHLTRYWELRVNGEVTDTLQLQAVVFYTAGQNPEQRANEQRPYIERYLKSIGQPAGTYTLEIQTREINDSANLR
jgi:hypothetical protein